MSCCTLISDTLTQNDKLQHVRVHLCRSISFPIFLSVSKHTPVTVTYLVLCLSYSIFHHSELCQQYEWNIVHAILQRHISAMIPLLTNEGERYPVQHNILSFIFYLWIFSYLLIILLINTEHQHKHNLQPFPCMMLFFWKVIHSCSDTILSTFNHTKAQT